MRVYTEKVSARVEMRTVLSKSITYQVLVDGAVVFDKTLNRYSQRNAQQLAREQEEKAMRRVHNNEQ